MQTQPTFCGEADYERWLLSALAAERQRLHLQRIPRPRPSHLQPNSSRQRAKQPPLPQPGNWDQLNRQFAGTTNETSTHTEKETQHDGSRTPLRTFKNQA
jgi:hypothetical protein